MTSQARISMTMRVRVVRYAEPGFDEWGGALPPTGEAQVIHDALPCLAWANMDTHEDITVERAAALGVMRLIVPSKTDIAETDILEDITDRQGVVLVKGPFSVEGISFRRDHLAVDAQVLKRGKS